MRVVNFLWALYCSPCGAAQYTAQLWRIVRLHSRHTQGCNVIETTRVAVIDVPLQ